MSVVRVECVRCWRHAASIPPGTMRDVTIVRKRASVCGYGKDCTLTLCWFWCSCVRCQKHITAAAKRFRCAEVLFHPKTYELPVGYNTTVGAKRFRFAEELFLPVTSELLDETCSILAPNASVARKCFRCAAVSFQPKNYELPDGNIITVGAERLRCADTEIGLAGSEGFGRHAHGQTSSLSSSSCSSTLVTV